MGNLKVVVGGGFGSEAKGRCVQWLADQDIAADRQVAVMRVGGPNAGHCVYDDQGNLWKLRHVPVGATNPAATLLIGPGSEVNADLLDEEIGAMQGAGHKIARRLFVDRNATLLEPRHIQAEVDQGMNARLGSTASGVGAARADRIWRMAELFGGEHDTREMAEEILSDGGTVIVEGTQGVGLGLHYGFYPQCTSGDTRAIDFLGQAGLSPWAPYVDDFEVWVVMRVHPIRVAGNSGPLKGETDWETLGLQPEVTTVTKRVRRVGEWDPELAHAAVRLNGGPSETVKIWLSMVDQSNPEVTGLHGPIDPNELSTEVLGALGDWSATVAVATGTAPSVFGTGPNTALWFEQ